MKNQSLLILGVLLLGLGSATGADGRPGDSPGAGVGSFFGQLRGQNADEPADPEKAFVVSVLTTRPNELTVDFRIDNCCYLYRDKVRIEVVPATPAILGAFQLPPGKPKTDEFLGRTEVYDKPFSVRVPILPAPDAVRSALKVTYQGCAETPVAICYAPTVKTFALGAISNTNTGAPGPAAPLAQTSLIGYLLGALGFGLLLTFTPCVLPMVPILSSVIVGQNGQTLTKLQGGLLSYSYVLGTAVTYSIAGAVAGATGSQLQAYFQNPWAIGLFAAVLVLLALSMFGLYKIDVPSAMQSFLHRHSERLHRRSQRIPGGVYAGVFALGAFSALIIGACASPILLAALSAALTTRDAWLGAITMFAMAHGQGVFLVALGVGAGSLLPRAGGWMEAVKHLFGALLIAVAIYLLGVLPAVPVLLLWGGFFIACGVYLGALQRAPAGGWARLRQATGIVLLVWGIAAMLGGFVGNRDVWQPLAHLTVIGARAGIDTAAASPLAEHRVRRLGELEQRLATAKAGGKPVLVDYYADWCTDCLRMESTTFRDPQVRLELQRFVLVQADVTDSNDPEAEALKKRFGVFAPPAIVLIDAAGHERLDLLRSSGYGYLSATQLIALLRQL
jgi:thioredoxin:protein disulfide reductase